MKILTRKAKTFLNYKIEITIAVALNLTTLSGKKTGINRKFEKLFSVLRRPISTTAKLELYEMKNWHFQNKPMKVCHFQFLILNSMRTEWHFEGEASQHKRKLKWKHLQYIVRKTKEILPFNPRPQDQSIFSICPIFAARFSRICWFRLNWVSLSYRKIEFQTLATSQKQ